MLAASLLSDQGMLPRSSVGALSKTNEDRHLLTDIGVPVALRRHAKADRGTSTAQLRADGERR